MDTFLARLRRHRSVMAVILTGLLAQVFVNLLSSWLEAIYGPAPGRIFQILLGLGVIIVVLWLVLRLLDRRPPVEIVPQEEKAPRFPGLVALVGPGRPDRDPMEQGAGVALAHHLATEGPGEPLRFAWLVTSRGEGGGVAVAEAFRARYADRCEVRVCTVADAFDLQETYAVVRRIYRQQVSDAGLDPHQVVADLTGGTAMMTAGMALACRDRWPMEYITGRPGTVSSPILVRWQQASEGAPAPENERQADTPSPDPSPETAENEKG